MYTKHVNFNETPQTAPIPGSNQVENNAGGYAWAIDDWKRLNRFLILGSEGGSYYQGEKDLTVENAQAVMRCIKEDGKRVVDVLTDISVRGRAHKNDPAVFVLALCSVAQDQSTREYAYYRLKEVLRTGGHLLKFAQYRDALGRWGMGVRKAISAWYLNREEEGKLVYQLTKYAQRDGWSQRDLIRKTHPDFGNKLFARLAVNATTDGRTVIRKNGKTRFYQKANGEMPPLLEGMYKAKEANVKQLPEIVRQYRLTREMLPSEAMTDAGVWEALLQDMPMTAMVRNLGNMSKVGLLKPMSESVRTIAARLTDTGRLKKARIHPFSILLAMKNYAAGHGFRGSGSWTVVPQITDALDEAFYLSFENIEPIGKRVLIGVDVSGSMSWELSSNLSCAEGAAAMSLAVAKCESQYFIHGFADAFVDLGITPRMRMDDVLRVTRRRNFGRTDCAVPMLYALQNNIPVDLFVVITDNETWFGNIHPAQALKQYRQKMGIDARLAVIAMTAGNFSIADPNDSGMMDLTGFDAAFHSILRQFGGGEI